MADQRSALGKIRYKRIITREKGAPISMVCTCGKSCKPGKDMSGADVMVCTHCNKSFITKKL